MTESLVFTHGWKHDRTVWSAMTAELPERLETTTWDLPYHGAAGPLDRPDEPVRAELVERLDEVVSGLAATSDSNKVVLVGHSLGGYISLSYALAHPHRVAGIVLMSTGPGFARSEARETWNQWARDNADPRSPNQELLVLHHDSYVIDHLDEVGPPALVILGSRDSRFESARHVFEARLPKVESLVIDGGGHNIHLTHGDLVAQHVARWLDRAL